MKKVVRNSKDDAKLKALIKKCKSLGIELDGDEDVETLQAYIEAFEEDEEEVEQEVENDDEENFDEEEDDEEEAEDEEEIDEEDDDDDESDEDDEDEDDDVEDDEEVDEEDEDDEEVDEEDEEEEVEEKIDLKSVEKMLKRMNRAGLKKTIKEYNLSIDVFKSMSDDEIREKILSALSSKNNDEEELEEFDDEQVEELKSSKTKTTNKTKTKKEQKMKVLIANNKLIKSFIDSMNRIGKFDVKVGNSNVVFKMNGTKIADLHKIKQTEDGILARFYIRLPFDKGKKISNLISESKIGHSVVEKFNISDLNKVKQVISKAIEFANSENDSTSKVSAKKVPAKKTKVVKNSKKR